MAAAIDINAGAEAGKIRLTQVDGLRAIAALSVVAFHYTTRFDELFLHVRPPGLGLPHGYLGVNLFFAISGFVIFMTIDRIRAPRDFVVSRFSRLFPVYWVAVALTWGVVSALSLPGYAVSWKEALFNLSMLQSFFSVRDVDGVYWSLQVELLFYIWMLLLWTAGWLRYPLRVCVAWLSVSLLAGVYTSITGSAISFTLNHFLLLDWAPWFSLGMTVYVSWRDGEFTLPHAGMVALCLVAIGVRTDVPAFVTGIVSFVLLFYAARNGWSWLAWRPLVFFGVISYPLYLVHEKIGWLIVLRIEEWFGWPWLGITAAFLCSVLLAVLLHRMIEKPASAAIRGWYRRLPQAVFGARLRWLAGTAGTLICLASTLVLTTRWNQDGRETRFSLALNEPANVQTGPCSRPFGRQLLLVMGQSNAASSGDVADGLPVQVFHDGRCLDTGDPLPGTSGSGSTIWTALLPLVGRDDLTIAPLAVGNTKISDWVEPGQLRNRYQRFLDGIQRSNLPVAAVLWQQGEADALAGTEAVAYRDALLALRKTLDDAGIRAPLYVAKSTACFGPASGPIRRAVDAATGLHDRILAGPDTDALGEGYRSDGCHLNAAGRQAAARQWRDILQLP